MCGRPEKNLGEAKARSNQAEEDLKATLDVQYQLEDIWRQARQDLVDLASEGAKA